MLPRSKLVAFEKSLIDNRFDVGDVRYDYV